MIPTRKVITTIGRNTQTRMFGSISNSVILVAWYYSGNPKTWIFGQENLIIFLLSGVPNEWVMWTTSSSSTSENVKLNESRRFEICNYHRGIRILGVEETQYLGNRDHILYGAAHKTHRKKFISQNEFQCIFFGGPSKMKCMCNVSRTHAISFHTSTFFLWFNALIGE